MRKVLRSQYGIISWGDKFSACWQANFIIGPSLPWKGQWFILTAYTYIPGMGLFFFVHRALASTILWRFKYLVHWCEILHNIASEQGAYFVTKVVWERTHDCGINVISHIALPRSWKPDRALEPLTEDTAEMPALEVILCGWHAILQDTVYALKQRPYMALCSQ